MHESQKGLGALGRPSTPREVNIEISEKQMSQFSFVEKTPFQLLDFPLWVKGTSHGQLMATRGEELAEKGF